MLLAEFIPDALTTEHSRVEIVNEGEARGGLRFVIQNGILANAMEVCLYPFRRTKDDKNSFLK